MIHASHACMPFCLPPGTSRTVAHTGFSCMRACSCMSACSRFCPCLCVSVCMHSFKIVRVFSRLKALQRIVYAISNTGIHLCNTYWAPLYPNPLRPSHVHMHRIHMRSHAHSIRHTHTHTHAHAHVHTHTVSHTHTRTHTRTHTHIHTHTGSSSSVSWCQYSLSLRSSCMANSCSKSSEHSAVLL